jgi:hypothetical protein
MRYVFRQIAVKRKLPLGSATTLRVRIHELLRLSGCGGKRQNVVSGSEKDAYLTQTCNAPQPAIIQVRSSAVSL